VWVRELDLDSETGTVKEMETDLGMHWETAKDSAKQSDLATESASGFPWEQDRHPPHMRAAWPPKEAKPTKELKPSCA
jgi:hypothetical protein